MKKLILAVAFLFVCGTLHATPTATFGACANNGGLSTITFSSVVIAANTAIVVGTGRATGGAGVVNSITWNTSETLSALGAASNASSVNADLRWILAPTATTANIVVNLSSTNDSVACYAKLTSVATVKTAVSSQDASAATPTNVNTNSATGELVIDVVAITGGAVGAAGAGQTALGSANITTAIGTGMSTEAGAASVTMTWVNTIGYAMVSASFASAGGNVVPAFTYQYRRRRGGD